MTVVDFPVKGSDEHKKAEQRAKRAEERAIRARKQQEENGKEPRPIVRVTTREHEVVNETLANLAGHPRLFQRSGMLVQVVKDKRPQEELDKQAIRIQAGSLYLKATGAALVREWISETNCLHRYSMQRELWEPCHVPDWLYQQVMARGQWENVRPIEFISETPFLRADGTVAEAPGYDRASGVVFAPSREFPPVPDAPSHEDVKAALSVLLEPFLDFPFAEEANRAAAVAGILSPLSRLATGPSPLFLVTKNLRGAGGTLLAQTIAIAASGRKMAVMTQAGDDEEERKRILSVAMAGHRMMLIDNIKRPLGGENIDAMLTATEWEDRKLGKSEVVRAPLHATWYATGNNTQIQGDTVRRILPIRLMSPEEKPEERSGFRHANLEVFVREEHPKLVTAALTVLRAYYVAGKPDMKLSEWGSFDGWNHTVRAALVWAGMVDPGLGRISVAEAADTEVESLKTIFANWREVDPTGSGLSTSKILKALSGHDLSDELDAVREAMLALFADPSTGKMPTDIKLGLQLKAFEGRNVGGKILSRVPGRANSKNWVIR